MATLSAIRQNCKKVSLFGETAPQDDHADCPSQVVAIGRNYADHVKELNNQRPKQPFFFLKPSTSILLPGEGPVLRPAGVNMHFEIELGIVMGKTVRDLDPNDEKAALDAIDTYLLTIDMTARNTQEEAKKKGLPWSIAKGFDTFLPISGPISKSIITDPHNVEIYLKVNGEYKQQDNTELMLFRIPRQIADISRVMTLEKGDIILTGTPKGVGPVKTGDVMSCGLRVNGKEIEEAKLEVPVKDRGGPYDFSET